MQIILDKGNEMKEVEVVAGIIKFNDEILCTQRDESKNEEVSFKWEFPGGKIEEGESGEDALKREIREELNMDIEVGEYFMEVKYAYSSFNLKMHTYFCVTHSKDLELLVHKNFKWIKMENLDTLDWAPADRVIIERLKNF